MDFLLKPLGWILQQFSALFSGNFAWAVFMFTLVVNLLMIPLSIKSQKSSVGQIRIKPKLDALKKKYGDDKQRYSMEMQKLYQQENISMSGGCLPMLIRLPIMMGIYSVVLSPLTYILNINNTVVTAATTAAGKLAEKSSYLELDVIEKIKTLSFSGKDTVEGALNEVDFNFFGIDLTKTPDFDINIFAKWDATWIIPILAFAAAMASSFITMAIQKKTNPDAPRMAGMMFTMPFISLIIGFSVPCAAGLYWAYSSIISSVIQAVVQIVYGPHKMIAAQQAKELRKRYKEEKAAKVKAEGEVTA